MPKGQRNYYEEAGDLLKGKSPEEYGPEFASRMRAKIGYPNQDLVTPEQLGLMALIGNPKDKNWNFHGVNFNESPNDKEGVARMNTFLAPVLSSNKQNAVPKGKTIFGIGANANTNTYSHELRHQKVEDEVENRVQDLLFGSTSLPSYRRNIQNSYDYLTGFDPKLKKTPLKEKEKYVLDAYGEQIARYIRKHKEEDSPPAKLDLIDFARAPDNSYTNFKEHLDRNKQGAVGAFIGDKKLPTYMIKQRSVFPALNFMGRLGEFGSKGYKTGGSIENTTHDRKLI